MPEQEGRRDRDEEALELADAGADLAGALAGGAVGLIGGPAGALGGAALGVAIQRTAKAVVGRLSAREEQRVGAALLLIDRDAREREERGDEPRADGFFNNRGALRPEAEDLLEAVLRQAAETYEERKVPFLARLYSAVAHDPTISASDALYLVRVAGALTYRQFVALGVYANHETHVRDLAHAHGRHEDGRAAPDEAVLLELSDLTDLRLIGVSNGGHVAPVNNVFAGLLSRGKTGYGQFRLLPTGERLAQITGAADIDAAEREAWVEALAGRWADEEASGLTASPQ